MKTDLHSQQPLQVEIIDKHSSTGRSSYFYFRREKSWDDRIQKAIGPAFVLALPSIIFILLIQSIHYNEDLSRIIFFMNDISKYFLIIWMLGQTFSSIYSALVIHEQSVKKSIIIILNKCSVPFIILVTIILFNFLNYMENDFNEFSKGNPLIAVGFVIMLISFSYLLQFIVVYRVQRMIEYLSTYNLNKQNILFDNMKILLPIILSFGSLLISFASLLVSLLKK